MVKPFSPEVVAEYTVAGAWLEKNLCQYLSSFADSNPGAIALVLALARQRSRRQRFR